MLLCKLHLREFLCEISKVRAEDNTLFYADLLCDCKKMSYRLDIVLSVCLINRCREFNSLVNARCKYEAVAACHHSNKLIIGKLKIVAENKLHLLGDRCSLGKRRKGN